MNEVIAFTAAFGMLGAAVLTVLALVLFPLQDRPYEGEDGELVPCGCAGCQR